MLVIAFASFIGEAKHTMLICNVGQTVPEEMSAVRNLSRQSGAQGRPFARAGRPEADRSGFALGGAGHRNLATWEISIERMALVGEYPPNAAAHSPSVALLDAERSALLRELERMHSNISRTADALGISRNTLYRKIHKHRIVLEQ